VHILAEPGKPAKQIVRDVQSLALAQHGIEIDHRMVSVVQLSDEEVADAQVKAESRASGRPAISSITLRTTSTDTEAGVALSHDGHVFEGKATGPAGLGHRPRVVAAAALRALDDILRTPADVESVMLAQVGGRNIAVCVITIVEPRVGELVLSGSAPVRDDDVSAVVRAVLDAVNRRIEASRIKS
jgi:hypothetical protein